jgi:type I restriction enzyme R subunit
VTAKQTAVIMPCPLDRFYLCLRPCAENAGEPAHEHKQLSVSAIRGQIEAYRFDLLVSELEMARLKKTGRWKDLKAQVVDQVSRLPMHLNPVREKSDAIKAVKSLSFWKDATFQELETLRNDLRGRMHYMAKTRFQAPAPKFIDIADGQENYQRLPVPLGVEEMAGYRRKILDAL